MALGPEPVGGIAGAPAASRSRFLPGPAAMLPLLRLTRRLPCNGFLNAGGFSNLTATLTANATAENRGSGSNANGRRRATVSRCSLGEVNLGNLVDSPVGGRLATRCTAATEIEPSRARRGVPQGSSRPSLARPASK